MRRILLTAAVFLSMATARATVYYVNGNKADNTGAGTSWANAKKDVQAAINLATADGDEVWVKAGTYLPTLDANGTTQTGSNARYHTFYIKNWDIKLYGGFAGTETLLAKRNALTNVTVLSGDIDAGGTSDCYHVMLTLNRSSACLIDGFTMQGGGKRMAPAASPFHHPLPPLTPTMAAVCSTTTVVRR